MKIATVSDIHGDWDKINYPKADLLIFAGDILLDYSDNKIIKINKQLEELIKLNKFLGELKDQDVYKEIIVVAGNHDFIFELMPDSHRYLTNAHYLQDTHVVINGLKFYGSPRTRWFFEWSFNLPCHLPKFGGDPEHADKVSEIVWGNIPSDVDVLITHGPPMGILDLTFSGVLAGDPILETRLEDLSQLKLHIFGHIHYSYGRIKKLINGRYVEFVNTAIHKDGEGLNPVPILIVD